MVSNLFIVKFMYKGYQREMLQFLILDNFLYRM